LAHLHRRAMPVLLRLRPLCSAGPGADTHTRRTAQSHAVVPCLACLIKPRTAIHLVPATSACCLIPTWQRGARERSQAPRSERIVSTGGEPLELVPATICKCKVRDPRPCRIPAIHFTSRSDCATMSGFPGVGEIMAWVDLAGRIRNAISICRDRSQHLEEFVECGATHACLGLLKVAAC
jgi:hypothetical protein